MKARLSNHHQAPRKVRVVADTIRGKSVADASRMLTFMPKYGAPVIKKLLDSAVANARHAGVSSEDLFVKTITVNKGLMSKRGRPFSRGRSGVIRKTMSHVVIELDRRAAVPAKARKAKVVTKKPVSAKTK